MKGISTSKRRYDKLDEIGFIGTQQKRSARKIKLDAVKTSRAIRRLSDPGKILKSSLLSSRPKKTAKKVHA